VHSFEIIKSLSLDREKYSAAIVPLITARNWEAIEEIKDENQSDFNEYLDIIKFYDQNQLLYVVTIYDSDELWQDPEVIDIFPLP
jgi:hypothetical protein